MEMLNTLAIDLCTDEAGYKIFGFLGNLVNILKILIPIILVLMGSIDLAKAVVASKDDDIKKAQGTLIKRAIAALVIFFLPAVVSVVVNMAGGSADTESNVCMKSLLDPKWAAEQLELKKNNKGSTKTDEECRVSNFTGCPSESIGR